MRNVKANSGNDLRVISSILCSADEAHPDGWTHAELPSVLLQQINDLNDPLRMKAFYSFIAGKLAADVKDWLAEGKGENWMRVFRQVRIHYTSKHPWLSKFPEIQGNLFE